MIAVMTEISRDDYPSATRFKLQEGGYLLVVDNKDEIAVYAPGKWIGAMNVAKDGISVNRGFVDKKGTT